MQISRHWRMNSQRYRLVGVRYNNGEVSLQSRQTPPNAEARREDDQIVQSSVTSAVPASR